LRPLEIDTLFKGRPRARRSDINPAAGHIFLTWDSVIPSGSNSLQSYNDGATTMVHEVMHHLGLIHPFGNTNAANAACGQDDYVIDTPVSLGGSWVFTGLLSTSSPAVHRRLWAAPC
jgi:hypothetical protein